MARSLLPFFWARFLERGREARRSSPRARRKQRVPTGPAREREPEPGWGEGSRVHLSTQTRLVLTLPHFATFWHPPPHGSQPRLPRSLRAGHTLLVSTSLCPLLPDPLPSSAAPPCSPRSPEVQTPRLWVPLGSLLHPGSLWSPPQASLPQFPASSVPGGSHGVWFLARRGAKWSQVEVGVEEKDRRPENHMLPKKTGTQDPRMQENNEQRAAEPRKGEMGDGRGWQSLCRRCSVPIQHHLSVLPLSAPHTCQVPE